MNISRELLLAQKTQALEERDNLIARLNARIGAINTLDHLLAVLELPEPPPATPTPHKAAASPLPHTAT